jgi:tRNA(Ile)-lysidine synthase
VDRPLAAARESGLVRAGEPLLVLLSGGADSVCLLDACLRLEARVSALHVNYGLRSGADADEAHCRELCQRLGAPLDVERVRLDSAAPEGAGNLQAEARERRYALAERRAVRAGGDYATAHTASDQAETVLYRLAVSPGRRALLGMPPRRGRLVRPLLAVTRDETRAYCEARGLAWREDPLNTDPRFARARVRHEVVPSLREIAPALERTIAETALLLRDENEVLEAAVDDAVERLGGEAVPLAELRSLPAGLARLVLRRLAEGAAGEQRSLSRDDADAVLRLGERGGTQSLDLGGGLRAVVEYGTLRFARGADAERDAPPPATLAVPGSVSFGAWEVRAREARADERAVGEEVFVAADRLGGEVTVRAWRAGDRMRPAGAGGSKSLQDLFVDRKVPRALRGTLPVVEAGGEIAWVAGVALAEGFGPGPERTGGLVALSARRGGG